jgi:hypothetical protein
MEGYTMSENEMKEFIDMRKQEYIDYGEAEELAEGFAYADLQERLELDNPV